VKVLQMQGAKDPDEFLKKFGADKFRQLLSQSKSKFDYNLEAILARHDINLQSEKVKALTESERLISETYSSAERDIYIQTVAKLFGVEIRSVKNDVEKMIEKAEKQWRKEESNKVKQEAIGYTDKVNPDFAKAPAVARNEENLLGLLLMYPEHRKAVFDRGLIGADDFITDLNKRIFTYLENAYFNNEDSHFDIDDHFTTDERGRMARMKSVRMELSENGDKVLLDSIDNLKKSVSKKLNEKNSSLDSLLNLIKSKQNN
jgi:DNA primase